MEGYALEMIGRMPFCSSDEIAGVLLRSLDEVRVEVRAMKAAGVVEVGFGGGVRGSPEKLYLTRAGAEELARRRGCTMEQLVVDGFVVTNDFLCGLFWGRSPVAPIFYGLAVAASSAVSGLSVPVVLAQTRLARMGQLWLDPGFTCEWGGSVRRFDGIR